MSGGIRYRKRLRMGPLPLWLNVSHSQSNGWTFSWSARMFGVTRNFTRNKTTVDLPGGLFYEGKSKSRRRTGSGPGTPVRPVYRPSFAPWVGWLLTSALVVGAAILFGTGVSALTVAIVSCLGFLIGFTQSMRARRAGMPVRRDTISPDGERR